MQQVRAGVEETKHETRQASGEALTDSAKGRVARRGNGPAGGPTHRLQLARILHGQLVDERRDHAARPAPWRAREGPVQKARLVTPVLRASGRRQSPSRRTRAATAGCGAHARARGQHGRAQGAQKSTNTGTGDFSTSASKVLSVTGIALLAAHTTRRVRGAPRDVGVRAAGATRAAGRTASACSSIRLLAPRRASILPEDTAVRSTQPFRPRSRARARSNAAPPPSERHACLRAAPSCFRLRPAGEDAGGAAAAVRRRPGAAH